MKTEVSARQPMNFRIQQRFSPLMASAPVWIIFILGLWLVVLKEFGPHWELVPGDLGDGRFNNYILEHFFLWINGSVPASSYWNAPFFYPYEYATAFSDNLLGAAPIYALFRWFGLDREAAFQCWYLCGFLLNYVAAAYVLSRAHLKPFAIGIGAFFFTFGIPLLSQGGHFQLYYRFGVPLACYFLLELFNHPKLTRLAAVAFWLVWQFYLSIYLGLFLIMLLVALAFLLPFFTNHEIGASLRARIYQWPIKLKQAWLQASLKERAFSLFVILAASTCFFALIWPYYKVSKGYGFLRGWIEVSQMLPVAQSFFLSDSDLLWKPISSLFGHSIEVRHEHQLFPGIAIAIMTLIGLIVQFKSKNSHIARLYFCAIVVLVIVTLNFYGFSIYWLIWKIPGVNSIRAVARIQMVWMWPLSFFVAWVMDEIIQQAQQKSRWVYMGVFLLTALLMTESTFFLQSYYVKADSVSRVAHLKDKIPEKLPQDPILVVAYSPSEQYYITELDAMLAAQELRWPTLNGYSGNNPSAYMFIQTCSAIPYLIENYLETLNLKKEVRLATHEKIMLRLVPVGFQNCKLIKGNH